MNKIFALLLVVGSLAAVALASDGQDAYWAPKTETKPSKTVEELIALNRDYIGRVDPDASPLFGFFPVWPAMLLGISGFFFVLAFISACVHLLGGYGRRKQIEDADKEYALEQQKLNEIAEKKRLRELIANKKQ